MIKRIWHNLSYLGIRDNTPKQLLGHIIFSNQLLATLFILSAALALLVYLRFGWYATAPMAVGSMVVYCVLLILNKFGFTTLTRLLISIFIPVYVLMVSLASKYAGIDTLEPYEYFEFRFVLLISPILPLSVFAYKEIKWIMWGLIPGIFCLFTYDKVHEWFGLGYGQVGFNDANYGFTNVVLVLCYLLLTISLIFLKMINSRLQEDNYFLIDSLNQSNKALLEKNKTLANLNQEIELQNEEIKSQSEELHKNHVLISSQADELTRKNKDLEHELIAKNNSLIKANQELIQHNNELRQFSFTLSHNLRGPVASLMGLINIFKTEDSEYNKNVISHIRKSATILEEVITDLSKILDIRNSIHEVKEQIEFESEIENIKTILKDTIQETNTVITTDFSKVAEIFSVKAFISSILFNLISNGIKYRSPDKICQIEISTERTENEIHIIVSDNGLGIDLSKHSEDLFQLYKRFHIHTEGKGLGLYLTNLQVQILGGSIEVQSEINQGTTFTIKLKDQENEGFQILHDSDYVEMFYDRLSNTCGLRWKKSPDSTSYREIGLLNLEVVKKYNVPNWISDWTGPIDTGLFDHVWILEKILPVAIEFGLSRVVIVADERKLEDKKESINHLKEKANEMGLEVRIFTRFDLARNWLVSFIKPEVL